MSKCSAVLLLPVLAVITLTSVDSRLRSNDLLPAQIQHHRFTQPQHQPPWAFAFAFTPAMMQNADLILLTGKSFYVSTNGSDSVSCAQAQSISSPRRTLNSAVSCLSPGDTLFVRGGVYAESLNNAIPSGTSWARPVTVAAYSGEQVTLRPSSGNSVFNASKSAYIVLEGLRFDAANVLFDAVEITFDGESYAHHIRIKDSEVMNAPHTGVGIHAGPTQRTDFNEFINVKVHDNGTTDFHHGFYVESSYNLFDRVESFNNAGWGIQVYTGTVGLPVEGNVIRNSSFHDNARVGDRGVGIGLYNGFGNVAYNNVVYNNSGGITANYGATATRIYNNTIYNNQRGDNKWGIYNGDDSDMGRTASIRAQIVNNITYGNQEDLRNPRQDALVLNNLAESDPKFTDPSDADFHLQAGSPAIDAGTNTFPLVRRDRDGIMRPVGAAFDIGAYEYLLPGNAGLVRRNVQRDVGRDLRYLYGSGTSGTSGHR